MKHGRSLWPPRTHNVPRTVDEGAFKADLEFEADLLFDKAVEFGDPHHTVVFKDVAIEDLADPFS